MDNRTRKCGFCELQAAHAGNFEGHLCKHLMAATLAERKACAKICEDEANKIRQCSLQNKDHHYLWCPTCAAMQDMALVLFKKIQERKD